MSINNPLRKPVFHLVDIGHRETSGRDDYMTVCGLVTSWESRQAGDWEWDIRKWTEMTRLWLYRLRNKFSYNMSLWFIMNKHDYSGFPTDSYDITIRELSPEQVIYVQLACDWLNDEKLIWTSVYDPFLIDYLDKPLMDQLE